MGNKIIFKLFRWQPSKETLIALAAGFCVIFLSALMIPLSPWPWASIVIRDIGQIYLAGILFPLAYISYSRGKWAEFGFTVRKWPVFLLIDIILGTLLFFILLTESSPQADFRLDTPALLSAAFVMVALCFELVFFYAFLRTLLERAFGIVPAVILTACFYAFHHIGFQPEYGKLIFVGLLYAITYRLGNSALIIFPFFLGIGGAYDVLVQSQVVSPIRFPGIRTAYLCILIAATLVWVRRKEF